MGETPAELLEMSNRKDGGVDGNKEKPDTAGDFAEKEDVAAETPQSGVIRERRTQNMGCSMSCVIGGAEEKSG